MIQWEYLTLVLEADAEREMDFLMHMRDWKSGIPRYTVEALIPRLNALGAEGWELVRMEPVKQGSKGDILVGDNGSGGIHGQTNIFALLNALERHPHNCD